MTIAREAWQIGDERIARACERVEQRGLADIRTTDESNDGQHIKLRCGTCNAAIGLPLETCPAAARVPRPWRSFVDPPGGYRTVDVFDVGGIVHHNRRCLNRMLRQTSAADDLAVVAVEHMHESVEIADHDVIADRDRGAEPAV